jgi:hypothetical protein
MTDSVNEFAFCETCRLREGEAVVICRLLLLDVNVTGKRSGPNQFDHVWSAAARRRFVRYKRLRLEVVTKRRRAAALQRELGDDLFARGFPFELLEN